MATGEPSRRVFYSWQSDLPNNTNRALIEKALEQAIKSLAKLGAVDLAEVDRDTRGVAGAPNITTTIFDKIAGATAFVADISTVNPLVKCLRIVVARVALENPSTRERQPDRQRELR